MAATPMTGGEALVRSLYNEGVRVVFGLPGVQLYGVMAALRDEPRIRFITTRHEQDTSFMADGYARAGGDFGTSLVVPGPGLLNAMSGLSTAYSASSPVLMLSGQIPRDSIGKDIGLLHEVNDQQDCIAPVTKWRRRVLQVADVPAAVREAARQLRSGRPRPVEIEMQPETMEDEGLVELLPPAEIERPAAAAHDIDRAAELLLASRAPLIYAGGGVHLSGAHDALAAVAEQLQAGVAQSAEGKGAVSDHNPLSLGAAFWRESPLRAHIHEADVVLAVGSRLATVSFKPGTRIIQIDADDREIGRSHKDTLGLVGDARATLEALLERLRATPPRPSRKAEHEARRFNEITGLWPNEQKRFRERLQGGVDPALLESWPRADKGGLSLSGKTLEHKPQAKLPEVAQYLRAKALGTLITKRLADGRLRKLSKQTLRVGGQAKGQGAPTKVGGPPGAPISPL